MVGSLQRFLKGANYSELICECMEAAWTIPSYKLSHSTKIAVKRMELKSFMTWEIEHLSSYKRQSLLFWRSAWEDPEKKLFYPVKIKLQFREFSWPPLCFCVVKIVSFPARLVVKRLITCHKNSNTTANESLAAEIVSLSVYTIPSKVFLTASNFELFKVSSLPRLES